MSDKILEFRDVCKNFHQVKAVNNVSFSLEKGKYMRFAGRTVPENQRS